MLSPPSSGEKTMPSIALTSAISRDGNKPRRTSVIDSAVPSVEEQGRVIWFSTREETLSQSRLRHVRPALTIQSTVTDVLMSLETLQLHATVWLFQTEQTIWKTLSADSRLTFCVKLAGMVDSSLPTMSCLKATLLPLGSVSMKRVCRRQESCMRASRRRAGMLSTIAFPLGQTGRLRLVVAFGCPRKADPQDNYLDAYVSVLKDVDPLNSSLVFNCGMGVVRSECLFHLRT